MKKIFLFAAIVGAMLAGCSKDKPELKLEIGQDYQGGKIAYLDATGKHGLIAAPSDQDAGSGIQWYNGSYGITGATGTDIGTGKNNTEKIVTAQGTMVSYAANLCKSLNLGGYTDWFLPSKDELNKLYENRVKIGGFSNAWYWSSSEYDLNYAWNQSFNGGNQATSNRSSNCRVRAVRAF